MNFDRCKECGKVTIAPRRWGETVICENCYQENLRKTEREKEEKIRADEREKVIEILKKCVFEIPYENSAFGYGTKAIDYSKAMKMLKEQKK